MNFAKYHALGNDYLILPATAEGEPPPGKQVRRICDRHYGIGADGVLLGPLASETCDFGLRLFNPDGTEFEKSGNGIRIFARYLWDHHLVGPERFTLQTPGGCVGCRVHPEGRGVTLEMGRISFFSPAIPTSGPDREVLDESLVAGDATFRICAATIGNPHCVVLCQEIKRELALHYGPLIEAHPMFPNRANVQFMKVLNRENIQIEIWERGAGYTLASGTSSCAAAAAAHRLGLCNSQIHVHSPGGCLEVSLGSDYSAVLTGSVTRICEGIVYEEALR